MLHILFTTYKHKKVMHMLFIVALLMLLREKERMNNDRVIGKTILPFRRL